MNGPRARLLLTASLLGAALPHAAAQVTLTPTRPGTVQMATPLEQARAAAAEARGSGAFPTPDNPGWRDAIDLGEAARDAAPDDPDTLRFLAETYSTLSWDARAWEAWEAYLAAGGTADAAAITALSEAGRELGYARYSAGELTEAAAVFGRVVELDPENLEATTWLARIALEAGRSEEAARSWRRVLKLRPGDPAARYYLGRAQQQRRYGTAASVAFNEGLAAYQTGQQDAALAAFVRAADANREFDEAARWAGRVALELGRPRVARRFWTQVLERNPADRSAAFFLELTGAQERWGAEAGRAFYAGQDLYNRGEVRAAAEQFAGASDANPEYPAAASWAARTLQESGQAARAVPFWERVVTLSPDDESARYFLEAARSQRAIGEGAAAAFNEGVGAYGQADLAGAQRAFETAVAEAPNYADAWAWLGRLAFEGGRYGRAAELYGRALGLEPGDATYRFFEAEARRLGEP